MLVPARGLAGCIVVRLVLLYVIRVVLSASPWVFNNVNGSASDCSSNCANNCGNNARNNAVFRASVFLGAGSLARVFL